MDKCNLVPTHLSRLRSSDTCIGTRTHCTDEGTTVVPKTQVHMLSGSPISWERSVSCHASSNYPHTKLKKKDLSSKRAHQTMAFLEPESIGMCEMMTQGDPKTTAGLVKGADLLNRLCEHPKWDMQCELALARDAARTCFMAAITIMPTTTLGPLLASMTTKYEAFKISDAKLDAVMRARIDAGVGAMANAYYAERESTSKCESMDESESENPPSGHSSSESSADSHMEQQPPNKRRKLTLTACEASSHARAKRKKRKKRRKDKKDRKRQKKKQSRESKMQSRQRKKQRERKKRAATKPASTTTTTATSTSTTAVTKSSTKTTTSSKIKRGSTNTCMRRLLTLQMAYSAMRVNEPHFTSAISRTCEPVMLVLASKPFMQDWAKFDAAQLKRHTDGDSDEAYQTCMHLPEQGSRTLFEFVGSMHSMYKKRDAFANSPKAQTLVCVARSDDVLSSGFWFRLQGRGLLQVRALRASMRDQSSRAGCVPRATVGTAQGHRWPEVHADVAMHTPRPRRGEAV